MRFPFQLTFKETPEHSPGRWKNMMKFREERMLTLNSKQLLLRGHWH